MDTDGHRSEREIICVNLCLSVVERMDFSQQEPFPATGCLKKPYWATTKGLRGRMGRTPAEGAGTSTSTSRSRSSANFNYILQSSGR